MSGKGEEEVDKGVEKWRMKKTIQALANAKGMASAGLITLMIPPKNQIALSVKMLNEEFGTASSIKSHTTKLAVQSAITSTLAKLKLYPRTPDNGLIIFCGNVMTEDNKEKKVCIDMVPFRPVSRANYICDNKFHVEELYRMLEDDDKFGFIVMDGNGSLFGTLSGNKRDVLHKFTVELPKKHGRGGQSAMRFARLRLEKRHNYVRKVGELATQFFITNDRPNVVGLILAGSAEFKNDLVGRESDLFDQRLSPIVMKLVDVAYGGENGFNQAIELSQDVLGNVKFIKEKRLITEFFESISTDNDMYCFGMEDTVRALEMGAVRVLMLWEELPHKHYIVTGPSWDHPREYNITEAEAQKLGIFKDEEGQQCEVEVEDFVEWCALNYKKFGCTLEFVTNKSQEGSQFVRGFQGVGGLLRYKVNFVELNELEKGHEEEEDTHAGGEDFCDEDFM
eukprot:TRINITY_DN13997_c0_g1_i1.p1 TRINITY_DN13997_c0_g1~~TRINITY_DN13997_c0_g1_i1.p1  ORF type:complete len:451 (+),score=222.08 TRINITY_DN13997_c0_g1_i1:96-1448(+)